MADSGYAPKPFVLVPFRKPSAAAVIKIEFDLRIKPKPKKNKWCHHNYFRFYSVFLSKLFFIIYLIKYSS